MAKSLSPAKPEGPAQTVSGWQGAGETATKEIESLLLSSTALPATGSSTTATGVTGKDLNALMIA
jgi:hypothetical protein